MNLRFWWFTGLFLSLLGRFSCRIFHILAAKLRLCLGFCSNGICIFGLYHHYSPHHQMNSKTSHHLQTHHQYHYHHSTLLPHLHHHLNLAHTFFVLGVQLLVWRIVGRIRSLKGGGYYQQSHPPYLTINTAQP